MKIRITAAGLYGIPMTAENPTGEYPIGHEIDLGDNEPPVGWAGRYVEVDGKAPKDAVAVTNPAQDGEDEAAERGTESKDEADKPRRGRPPANG